MTALSHIEKTTVSSRDVKCTLYSSDCLIYIYTGSHFVNYIIDLMMVSSESKDNNSIDLI